MPSDAKLQLSNKYLLEFDRLAQLLNAACRDGRERIPRADLADAVGLADRHVKQLCGFAQAFGLLKNITLRPTALGRLIYQHDPFFDDLGTLWYLHYIISSDPRHLIWCRLVTEVIPTYRTFTREQARATFDDLRGIFSEDSIKKHVLSELNTVLDAYTNQNLSRLAYLKLNGDGYTLGYREPIPALIVAASIVHYRDEYQDGASAVGIQNLLTDRYGPSVVFQLSEERFRSVLEELKTQPGLSLESRADLDQVRLAEAITADDWMRRYYEQR
jgi:hypothetical protein